jgi:FixJ family two-component response regulator
MQNHSFSATDLPINLIEPDARIRCEIVKATSQIGYHCEPYAGLSELAAHPPRRGIIIARDQLEGESVASILERLLGLGIWLPVVVFDFQPVPSRVVDAIKSGALDYLSWPFQPERLATSIARISQEALDVSAARQRMIDARSRLSKLSRREMDVLEGLANGGTNKAIARELCLSPRTVEIHRAHMMLKLGARHPADVIRIKNQATPARAA